MCVSHGAESWKFQKEPEKRQVEAVKHIILAEVNVKEIEFVSDDSGLLKKKAKANFKTLGKKAGAQMKALAAAIQDMTQEHIRTLEKTGTYTLTLNQMSYELLSEDVEILSEDIPGWQVASTGRLTVALDINITEKLREEGIARELVNRLQNLRKEKGFEVTDKINVIIKSHPLLTSSVVSNKNYICAEILAASLEMVENIDLEEASTVEIDESLIIQTTIKKA